MLKKVVIILVVLGAIGGGYGWYLFNKEVPSLADATPDFTVEAPELFEAFNEDESAANGKYLGKVVEVSGTILETDKKEQLVNINLDSGSDFGYVSCKLDSTYADVALKEGQQITLKCQCTGFLMDVVLNRCAVVK